MQSSRVPPGPRQICFFVVDAGRARLLQCSRVSHGRIHVDELIRNDGEPEPLGHVDAGLSLRDGEEPPGQSLVVVEARLVLLDVDVDRPIECGLHVPLILLRLLVEISQPGRELLGGPCVARVERRRELAPLWVLLHCSQGKWSICLISRDVCM